VATATAARPAPAGAPLAPSRAHVRPPGGLVAAALVAAVLFGVPLAYLVWHDAALGSAFFDVLRNEDVGVPLRNTLVLATTVSLAATVLGTSLAWLVTRTDLPGRRIWRMVVPLPLVMPSFVGAFALIAAFAPGGLLDTLVGFDSAPRIEGFWAAASVLTLLTYPYVYLPVAARLTVLPRSLEESARALGRRPSAVFRTIVFPQCTGAMWAGALLVFLYTLSEFGSVQLLHYETLTRAIFASWLFDRDTAMSLSLVLAVIALTVVIAERTISRRRVQTDAVAPAADAVQHELGPWRWPALGLTGAVITLALVVPVVVLAHWTLRGVLGDATLDAGDLVDPAITTALLGVAAAVVTVAIVLPVAFLTVRYRSLAGEAANAVVVSGFALPGLVLALSIVFFVVRSSTLTDLVYQTFALLVFAYAVHFGSQALRASQVAVGGVPRRLEDAAQSLGANRTRRLATVQLPLMRPGLLAGAGLVLLSTMKELPATLILAPPNTETLATEIWHSTETGYFAQAGLTALTLLALSAVLTYALTIRPAGRPAGRTRTA
jgi:iron(III) transport system permease protein